MGNFGVLNAEIKHMQKYEKWNIRCLDSKYLDFRH